MVFRPGQFLVPEFHLSDNNAFVSSQIGYAIVIADVPNSWFSTGVATSGDVLSVRFSCETSRYVSCYVMTHQIGVRKASFTEAAVDGAAGPPPYPQR